MTQIANPPGREQGLPALLDPEAALETSASHAVTVIPAASRVALTLPADCHAVRNGVVLNLWAVAERRVSCATWSTITIRMRANQLLASMPEVRILKTCKEKDGLVVRPPCIEARRSQAMDRGVSDSAPPAAGDSEAWLYRQPDAPGASAQ